LARHHSGRDFERRVEVDNSVALVVVCVALDLPLREGQTSVEFVPELAPIVFSSTLSTIAFSGGLT